MQLFLARYCNATPPRFLAMRNSPSLWVYQYSYLVYDLYIIIYNLRNKNEHPYTVARLHSLLLPRSNLAGVSDEAVRFLETGF